MSNLENNLFIDTPENLVLEAQIAGFGGRFIAAMFDYVIMYAIILLFGCLFARSFIYQTESNRWAWGILILIQFIVFFFYHLLFEFAWNGQTPGKRWMGMRVIQANGLPLTASGLLIRNFVRLVDFLPVFYGVGLLSFFITKHTQRLGDLAAQTVVIYEYKQLTLKSLREDYTIQYFFVDRSDPLPSYITLDSFNETDRRVIVDYLQRRWNFTMTRPYLVIPIAARLAEAMGVHTLLQLNSVQSAETFLEQIARAFEIDERGQWPPPDPVKRTLDAPAPTIQQLAEFPPKPSSSTQQRSHTAWQGFDVEEPSIEALLGDDAPSNPPPSESLPPPSRPDDFPERGAT